MKKIIRFLFFGVLLFISYFSFNYTSGPGGGYSNAPSESNCTSCHSGSLVTSGSNWSNISFSGNFIGGGYIPDSIYTITLSHKHPGISKFGFQITALSAANDDPAGELKSGSSSRVQVRSRSYSGKTRYYIEHTSAGTSRVATDSTAWTFEWQAPSSNIGDVKFYAVVNAANGNSATSGDVILAKTFTVRASDSLPVAQANADTNVVCQKSVLKFRAGGTGNPTAYSWRFPGGSPSTSTDANPEITYNTTGNYNAILTVSNKFGSSKPDTLKIRVNSAPNAIVAGAANRLKCTEAEETLIADFVSGATYLWSNGQRTRDITTSDTGVFKVEVTANGCSNVSNEVRIGNFPRRNISLSSNVFGDSICQGGNLILSASDGFVRYRFFDGNTLIADIDSAVHHVQVNQNARYRVVATDSNQCRSDTSAYRFMYIAPQIDTPRIQCVNRDAFFIDFEWTVFDHYNSFQISLDSGKTWRIPSGGSTNTHRATGLYPDTDYEVWVRGRSNGPCAFSPIGKTICRTGQCNNLSISVQADTTVCKGNTIEVTINGLKNQSYSIAFEQLGYFTDTIFRFIPSISKNYQVEVFDSSAPGCPPTIRSFNVRVDELPDVALEPEGRNVLFCVGKPIEFIATSGADQYSFFKNGLLQQRSSERSWTPASVVNADSVFVISQKGACTDTSDMVSLLILPLPDATFSFQRAGSVYSFTPLKRGLSAYNWDFGQGLTSQDETPEVDFSSRNGTTFNVKLTVKDAANCEGESIESIEVPDFSHAESFAKTGMLSAYPNPAKNYLKLEQTQGKEWNYRMSDVGGRIVISGSFKESTYELNIGSLLPGWYVLDAVSEGVGHQHFRILVY